MWSQQLLVMQTNSWAAKYLVLVVWKEYKHDCDYQRHWLTTFTSDRKNWLRLDRPREWCRRGQTLPLFTIQPNSSEKHSELIFQIKLGLTYWINTSANVVFVDRSFYLSKDIYFTGLMTFTQRFPWPREPFSSTWQPLWVLTDLNLTLKFFTLT